MEETPDQILARLQRHADSVRRGAKPPATGGEAAGLPRAVPGSASGLPPRSLLHANPSAAPAPPATPPGTLVVHWGTEAASDLIPAETARSPRFGLLLRTIAGQALAVFACVLALALSISLKPVAALIVIGVLVAAGVVGTVRKLPFAGWCTLGLVIGGALGRFS